MTVALDKYDNVKEDAINNAASKLNDDIGTAKSELGEHQTSTIDGWKIAPAKEKLNSAYTKIIGEEYCGKLEKDLSNTITVCGLVTEFKAKAAEIKAEKSNLESLMTALQDNNTLLQKAGENDDTSKVRAAIKQLKETDIPASEDKIAQLEGELEKIDKEIESYIK